MDSIPTLLYHRILGMSQVTPSTIRGFAKGIMMYGLMPQVPEQWKSLLPPRLQTEPVVWLAEGIYQGFECGRILQIETDKLYKAKLYNLNLPDVGWWVYEGLIPPQAIQILNIMKASG